MEALKTEPHWLIPPLPLPPDLNPQTLTENLGQSPTPAQTFRHQSPNFDSF